MGHFMSMKGKFITKFLGTLRGIGYGLEDLGRTLGRIKYKGVSYSSFSGYRSYAPATRKGLYNLKTRGLIEDFDQNRFRFTSKGVQWYRRSVHTYFKEAYPRWDKKWRIVLFDIPQERHKDRRSLRRRLKYLGFRPMQKSVFVFPYPCEEELGEFCARLGVSEYVDVITAQNAGVHEEEVRKHFGL